MILLFAGYAGGAVQNSSVLPRTVGDRNHH